MATKSLVFDADDTLEQRTNEAQKEEAVPQRIAPVFLFDAAS